MLLVGLLQAAAYLWAGLDAREGPGYALPQPDTFFYCQSARRIAEGHPFSFSEGTAVSTGTTTVAYPFVLAVPYALGCTGDAMLLVGWFLNAAFYIVYLVGWGAVIRRKFEGDPGGALVAGLLVALFGQVAFVVFSQSDIGIWLAVSAGFAAALAADSTRLLALTLLAGPWIRPEGMICVAAFAAFAPFAPSGRRRRDLTLAAAGLVSCLGVFGLNWALTGEAQFASVAQKGYFKNLAFVPALAATARDAWNDVHDFFLGLPGNGARAWYFPPLIVAFLAWVGVVVRRWRTPGLRAELTWLAAVLGGYTTVVTSGWQDTNMDRYLAWTMPTILVAAGCGASAAARGLRAFPLVRWLPGATAVSFVAVGAVVMLAFFRGVTAGIDFDRAFGVEAEKAMPPGASVGTLCNCSIAYNFSPRRVVHLLGIYSPEVRVPVGSCPFEKLKNDPAVRFDYWYDEGALKRLLDDSSLPVIGEPVLKDLYRQDLYRAKWEAFDCAARPPTLPGLSPVGRMDAGYGEDEIRAGFRVLPGGHAGFPFSVDGRLGEEIAFESGRVISGRVEFWLDARPGENAVLLLRTAAHGVDYTFDGLHKRGTRVDVPSPLPIGLEVNGHDLGDRVSEIAEAGFSDICLDIPAHVLTGSRAHVVLCGEFPFFTCWLYQPARL